LQESNDGGEEIKPCTECTKIDQLGDNTTEIKHRMIQTRNTIINALNSICWHKKNRKL
jgi:Zn-finger protein